MQNIQVLRYIMLFNFFLQNDYIFSNQFVFNPIIHNVLKWPDLL